MNSENIGIALLLFLAHGQEIKMTQFELFAVEDEETISSSDDTENNSWSGQEYHPIQDLDSNRKRKRGRKLEYNTGACNTHRKEHKRCPKECSRRIRIGRKLE